MKFRSLTAVAALCVCFVPQASHAADADRAFVAKVSEGRMFEVMTGPLAADQGDTQAFKKNMTGSKH